jgi:hypothetical protein
MGRVCTWNENSLVINPAFPTTDPRHTVSKVHRHLTDSGEAGESGLYDPHVITTANGVKYQRLPNAQAKCELCEAGDMIPPWKRFRNTTYRPSLLRYIYTRIRAMIKP